MKILITGGAGFLGSNLVKKFLNVENHVTVLDDLSTGQIKNIEPYMQNENFDFIEGDIRRENTILTKHDLILNFACPASPIHYQADPVKTIETCIFGIRNMLHLANEWKSRLIQASTSEIYGDPTVNPQVEEYWGNVNPIGIRSCYDEGKRAAETIAFDYMRQFNVDVRIIRIFNTYGPNMAVNDGRVVSNLIIQALKNENITIYGNGGQTRSFCFVDDLISGIESMAYLNINPKTPINLGNPNEFTILQLAELIIKLTKSKSRIIFLELPQDDPKQRKPDIAKATSILHWSPRIDLAQGLIQTIRYFEKEI